MSKVDFRNLVGRVGRIKFNLYGNVFLTRINPKIKPEKFTEFLQKDVPDQKISLSVIDELKPEERKQIIDCLIQGDKGLEAITAFEHQALIRKFSLILLRDIIHGRNSAVKKAFADCLDSSIEQKIIAAFDKGENKPDDDINASVDQTNGICAKIRNENLHYPDPDDEDCYENLIAFLTELHSAFKWGVYEKEKLGDVENFSWLATVLLQWIKGYGLGQIIEGSLNNAKNRMYTPKAKKVRIGKDLVFYDGTRPHQNILIGDTLEAIENTILFSLANYFLKFTDAYTRIKGKTDNDWYEFVEYGTTNKLTIMLQRIGFSREAALYLKKYYGDYIIPTEDGDKLSRKAINACKNQAVIANAPDVILNVPEMFVD
jgi:hypothetical protein